MINIKPPSPMTDYVVPNAEEERLLASIFNLHENLNRIEFNEKQQLFHVVWDKHGDTTRRDSQQEGTFGWQTVADDLTDSFVSIFCDIIQDKLLGNHKLSFKEVKLHYELFQEYAKRLHKN